MLGVGDADEAPRLSAGEIPALATCLGEQFFGIADEAPFPTARLQEQVTRRVGCHIGTRGRHGDRGHITLGVADARSHYGAAAHRVPQQGQPAGINFGLLDQNTVGRIHSGLQAVRSHWLWVRAVPGEVPQQHSIARVRQRVAVAEHQLPGTGEPMRHEHARHTLCACRRQVEHRYPVAAQLADHQPARRSRDLPPGNGDQGQSDDQE